MKKFLVIFCSFVGLLIVANTVHAIEVEPFVKLGTIDASEPGHHGAIGHKCLMGVGVDIVAGDRWRKKLRAEFWTAAEPTDEDREIPHDGINITGKLSYCFNPNSDIKFSPFAGLGFERWRRNSPLEDPDRFYGDLNFIKTVFGLGVKYKNYYAEIGSLLPLWSDTDSGQKPGGKLGLTANIGMKWKKVGLEVFYSNKEFSGDGSQTDFQLEQYGLMIKYRIM